jgi:hypothetical protein
MFLLVCAAFAQEPAPIVMPPTVLEVPPPAPQVTVITPRQPPVIEVEVEILVPESVGVSALR